MSNDKLFGFSSNKELKVTFILKYFFQILTILGATLMALAGDFAYKYSEAVLLCDKQDNCYFPYIFNDWVCLVLGIIIGITGLVGTASDSKELKSNNEILKKENRKLKKVESDLNNAQEDYSKLFDRLHQKHSDVVKTWLKMISTEIKLTTYERLTIYYEHTEEFTLLSRFSQNKQFNKIHSQKFPLNEGVISKSWQHNSYKEEKSPLFHDEEEEYYTYMEKEYGYKRERLSEITMKCDRFFGIAIQEADDSIGVLLYEKISQEGDTDFNDKCDKLIAQSQKYESYLTKYVHDAIDLDRTIHINNNESAEDDLLKSFEEDNKK